MEKFLNLKIITHAKTFYNGKILALSLRTKSGGEIVLQPNRSEFLSTIDICKLIFWTYPEKKKIVHSISDGIVFADSQKVNIITDDIILDSDIDLLRAEYDRDQAMEGIKNTKDSDSLNYLEIKLRKAINRINIYNESK
ncbi:ATP synthase delta/epsilon chain alpha-helix domain-containing protein [Mycoplasmopsis primatum]|uniref:ATP synthase delta/epsilon chain alpha-helix domain-containing protein n=1 Tax=Mycoplasmopsis primatum TaxID=55604 RepID=UPI00049815A3|nr:ATP synthase delta/epsilon chain alpha-helix domain-containing protein [Mycoplasmopsis primatum]